eukprot:SM000174S03337  [mRNA]  locus=s174:31735:34103:- [translate_table: standard]
MHKSPPPPKRSPPPPKRSPPPPKRPPPPPHSPPPEAPLRRSPSPPPISPPPVQGQGQGCSADRVTINVASPDDIKKRTEYLSTQTVVLVLQHDITVPSTLRLDKSYSCTIMTSQGANTYTIRTQNDRSVAVLITGVQHFLMVRVSVYVPIVVDKSPSPCPYKVYQHLQIGYCPAVVISYSNLVQIVKGKFDGAIHLFTSTNSLIDSNTITTHDFSVIVGGTGGGKWTTTKMNHVVSNNRISGEIVGINVAYGAVGVEVSNNYITDFIFAGISLGRGVHNTGDAMFITLSNNYMDIKSETPYIPDSTGIYMVTHWINPGNHLKCNYVVGSIPHCVYLDFASSGYQIDGQVCVGTGNGLKANTGHNNNILGMVIADPYAQPGFIAPQLNWNCVSDPGTSWDSDRRKYFDTPDFQKAYPWLQDFCKITHVNGHNCNAPGGLTQEQTGGCSGMPTGNVWESVVLAGKTKHVPEFFGLTLLPALSDVNTIEYLMYPGASAFAVNAINGLQFNDPASNDYGLRPTSPIYKTFPKFPSCPIGNTGPKYVPESYYYLRF